MINKLRFNLWCIICSSLILWSGADANAQSYTIETLPLLPNPNVQSCVANAIDNQGTNIVGDCYSAIVPIGVYWDSQKNVHELAIDNYNQGWLINPSSINSKGQVSGYYQTTFNTAIKYPFFMNSVTDSSVYTIPVPAKYQGTCLVKAMNSSGEVTGTCETQGAGIVLGKAFRWSQSKGFDALPGITGCGHSEATAISDDGTILGVSSKCNSLPQLRFWKRTANGVTSQIVTGCQGVNSEQNFENLVFGPNGLLGGMCNAQSFIESASGVMINLYPSSVLSNVIGFSDSGVAVGNYGGYGMIATYNSVTQIWTPTLLSNVIPPGSPFPIGAFNVNAAGQIVGQASAIGVGAPAFVMTPVQP